MQNRMTMQSANQQTSRQNAPRNRRTRKAISQTQAYVATGFVLVYLLAVTASTIAMAAVL